MSAVLTFQPRIMQREVLRYTTGRMGVSAVPGSGKTHTLSALAARLIADGWVAEYQEILIVTLANSAVNNFAYRINEFIKAYGLIPGVGYRVRTLHSLAHEIVRERPDLVGLSDRFEIVDERESGEILRSVVTNWMRANPEFSAEWLNPEIDEARAHDANRQWGDTLISLAGALIKKSKDLMTTPQELRTKLNGLQRTPSLLRFAADVYADYQRALNFRSAVDFDDLIRLALQALQTDGDYLERLRARWPYILEDESQDSSELQERILRLLTGPEGNWVRVGDPNQAIYETFTTASPHFLLDFRKETGVLAPNLAESGRSTKSIIGLANHLISWTREAHPVRELREALTLPYILPTQPDDPQPNPEDQPEGIKLINTRYTPEKEIEAIVRSLKHWLPEHSDWTVAVLTPRNERGAKVVEALQEAGIEVVELLQSSQSTRETAEMLAAVLKALADPTAPRKLADVYTRLPLPPEVDPAQGTALKAAGADVLQKCANLEDFIWPLPGSDWLEMLAGGPEIIRDLMAFRSYIQRWQAAVLLPVDQLVLTIATDIFGNPSDLAMAHKLALLLERAGALHPEWQLPDFANELGEISRNRRKLLGFGEEDSGFDPDRHRGKVVVATIHKAKGLEWDRVYLMSVNNYDFPGAQPYDRYISERWYVRGSLNLEAEGLAQLEALIRGDVAGIYMEEGAATQEARFDYSAERLRLLYVGITRAKRELIVTWNTGKIIKSEAQPATALVELQAFWEKKYAAAG